MFFLLLLQLLNVFDWIECCLHSKWNEMNEPVAIAGIRSLLDIEQRREEKEEAEKNCRPANLEHDWWLFRSYTTNTNGAIIGQSHNTFRARIRGEIYVCTRRNMHMCWVVYRSAIKLCGNTHRQLRQRFPYYCMMDCVFISV